MLKNTRVVRNSHARVKIFLLSTNQSPSCNMRDFLFKELISSHQEIWGELSWRNIRNFLRADFFICLFVFRDLEVTSLNFSGFGSYLLKFNKVCNLEARKFHFLKYKAFLRQGFFIFWARKVTSWNIRSFLGCRFLEI